MYIMWLSSLEYVQISQIYVSQLFHVTAPWRLYNGDWVIYNHDDPFHKKYCSALSYFKFCLVAPAIPNLRHYNLSLHCESIV